MPAHWGQNFLTDAAWRRRVAAAVAPQGGEHIIEIGGGGGGVSAILAAAGCRLTIVEIDPRLTAGLQSRFAGEERVRVVGGDILALDWRELAAGTEPRGSSGAAAPRERKPRLFGNLPYYITGPILLRFFRHVEFFRDATFMVQREIAERLTAAPGPDYGRLSAAAQFFCQPRRLFDLPPGAFRPRPQVWSSLVAMAPAEPPPGGQEAREAFLDFLRLAFGQKRKRLVNNLKTGWPMAGIERAMAEARMAPGCRAEEYGAEALWRLFQALDAIHL